MFLSSAGSEYVRLTILTPCNPHASAHRMYSSASFLRKLSSVWAETGLPKLAGTWHWKPYDRGTGKQCVTARQTSMAQATNTTAREEPLQSNQSARSSERHDRSAMSLVGRSKPVLPSGPSDPSAMGTAAAAAANTASSKPRPFLDGIFRASCNYCVRCGVMLRVRLFSWCTLFRLTLFRLTLRSLERCGEALEAMNACMHAGRQPGSRVLQLTAEIIFFRRTYCWPRIIAFIGTRHTCRAARWKLFFAPNGG